MDKEEFRPYIPAEKSLPELTVMAVVVGLVLAVVFGGANAYLGLRVGMTVSASIPAAVISMAVIRIVLRRNSILENNMVQTIGSAGEALAAGCIFTLPALFMWANEWGTEAPSIVEISAIAFAGGVLGVFFMIPLRKALIVKEHGVLPYPEGTACADIQLAGEQGGQASKIFAGLGIGAVYKIICDGIKLFPSEISFNIPSFKGAAIGANVTPALLGVGYICGFRVSAVLFAGGILSWMCIMPCIALFGGDVTVFPSDVPISQMAPDDLWSNYIRYIGAGALVVAGLISLVKALPLIGSTLKESIGSFKGAGRNGVLRTDRDLDLRILVGGIVLIVVLIAALPVIPVGIGGAILIAIFGFLFATVASRIVGVVGSSNNPASGMTIAAMLITAFVFAATGQTGHEGMVAVLIVGAVICCIVAVAADTSQDLKTGYIIGATPYKQQIGEFIGIAVSALTIGGVLYLLNSAWGFGSEELAAPQAMLMKMVVEGVMDANLPWGLVFMGGAIAVIVELLGVPALPFAIGLYLPIASTAPIFVGGILRWAVDRKKFADEKRKEEVTNNGTLFASGLIAGEGIIGILLALAAVVGFDMDISEMFTLGPIGAIVFFAALIAVFVLFAFSQKKNAEAQER